MKKDSWRIPPPLHDKVLIARLTLGEWFAVGILSLILFGVFTSSGSSKALPYLAIPAVLYVLFRRNETDHGYINGVEMLRRYLLYFYNYATGGDTFVLERSVRSSEHKEETETSK